MENQDVIMKLNEPGKQLYAMLKEHSQVSSFTTSQIERILSFQDRINVVDNTGVSSDVYPKRFKIKGKGKHGGYLDTARFLNALLCNPYSKKTRRLQEEPVAQA